MKKCNCFLGGKSSVWHISYRENGSQFVSSSHLGFLILLNAIFALVNGVLYKSNLNYSANLLTKNCRKGWLTFSKILLKRYSNLMNHNFPHCSSQMLPKTINIDYFKTFWQPLWNFRHLWELKMRSKYWFLSDLSKITKFCKWNFLFCHLKVLLSSFKCLGYVQKSHFLQDILNDTSPVYSPDITRCSSWFCSHIFRITFNPRPTKLFFVTWFTKGGGYHPLMNLKLTGPKYDCLVPWYRVGSPLFLLILKSWKSVNIWCHNDVFKHGRTQKADFSEHRPKLTKSQFFR